MVNVQQGKTRTVNYCGLMFTILPGLQNGTTGKQFWRIEADGQVVTDCCMSLSKAGVVIHRHAVACGAYGNVVTRCQETGTAYPTLPYIK